MSVNEVLVLWKSLTYVMEAYVWNDYSQK